MAFDDNTNAGGDPVLPPSKFGAGYSVGPNAAPATPPSSYTPPPAVPPPPPPPPAPITGYPAVPAADPAFDSGLSYPQPVPPPPDAVPSVGYPPAPSVGYPPAPSGAYPPAPVPPPPAAPGYAPGYGVDAYAPYGRDPATGEPLSDKTAVAAGLLQLFLGAFGAGRFYIGSTGPAIGQLVLGILGLPTFGVTWVIVGIWALVDAIMMFTGSVRDGQGRKLR